MKVGLALGWQNSDWDRYDNQDFSRPPAVPDWKIFEDNLFLGDLAEPLGFDSIFSVEHHMTPYHMTPSGPQLLAHLAARTEQVDLGTALIVIPWYNPIRLAEQLCFLDNILSDKRKLWLGVGRGTSPREYEAMGVDQNEARGRFKEGIDILRLAFEEERFDYHGEFFNYDNISVRPRPRSQDLVDRLYAGVVTPPSIEIAARMGLKLMFTQNASFEDLAQKVVYFNAVRAEGGLAPMNPILAPQFFCAATEEKAQELGGKAMATFMSAGSKHYEFDNAARFASIKGYEHYAQTFAGGIPEDQIGTMIGTPDQLISTFQWIADHIRPSQIVVITNQGGLPRDAFEESLRLFAKEVLPVVQKMTPAPFDTVASV